MTLKITYKCTFLFHVHVKLKLLMNDRLTAAFDTHDKCGWVGGNDVQKELGWECAVFAFLKTGSKREF